MNFIEAAIFLLFLAIISVPLANRLRLPLEIFLVIGSCLISLLPGLPVFQVNPLIVFNLFLPPILFSAAYFTSWKDFKFNLRPISLFAFGLVIFTMITVAIVAKLLLPEFTWGEGFLLGAILSPTDASAAVNIIKKIGANRRLIVILEGESLINDATALTLFRFSLAGLMLNTFSITNAISHFLFALAGGAIIGLILGVVAIYFIRRIRETSAETTFTFIVAYIAYLTAEHLGVSGVISTVVCGIYVGIRFPECVPTDTRVNAKVSWKTLMFIINGFAFTLLGLELPWVLKSLTSYSAVSLVFYVVAITITVILTRLLWVYPAAYLPRKLVPSIVKKDPMPVWQMLFTLGWTGMRGIVSLAAALAIPLEMAPGVAFPHRDLLIFLTYFVVVATLIMPSISLPFLIKIFNLSDAPQIKMQQEAYARMKSLEGVLEKIAEIVRNEKIPSYLFDEFKTQIQRRIEIIQTQLQANPYSTLNSEYFAIKKLTMAAIESEKETLIKLRKSGEIQDEIFHLLLDELDLEEMRAKSLRI